MVEEPAAVAAFTSEARSRGSCARSRSRSTCRMKQVVCNTALGRRDSHSPPGGHAINSKRG